MKINTYKAKPIGISALLACLCVTGALFSCGEGSTTDPANTDSAPSGEALTEPIDTGNGRSDALDSLPETLDFDGAVVKLLARGGDIDVKAEFFSEGTNGDVVNDAVFARNQAVEERLNVVMELKTADNKTRHDYMGDDIRKSVMADSDDFDIAANAMYNQMPLSIEGLYTDLNTIEYLDFTQPWWNRAFKELTEFEGKNYVCMGELSQTMISGAFCMFFNKTMFREFYPDEPSLYETVNAGTWTLDKLISYCTPMYADLNGNGQADEGDRYGNYYRNDQSLGADSFSGGCNINMMVKNNDGTYAYNGTSDRTAMFVEKMEELLFENNNTMRWTYNDDTIMTAMLDEQVLFLTWMLTGVNDLRDMKSDYGIIPMPKLDETQENYNAFCHDGSTAFAIPVTVNDVDMVGAFLEAMSAETYRSVTPAYFETALKGKYSRDNETSQMLDMIVGGIYLDIGYIYGQNLGAPISIIRTILSNSTQCGKAASTLASVEKSILKQMETILDKYAEIES